MSEEVVTQVTADTPAPVQQETAPVEAQVSTPEVDTPEVAPRTFTQEEMDAIIGKRLAKEQRKWSRDQTQVPSRPPVDVVPENFSSNEAYIDALATQRAETLIVQREQSRAQAEIRDGYADKVLDAKEKYADFEKVAHHDWDPTPAMAEAIFASEIGPDIAYYLGSNRAEATRIAKLPSPAMQAKEIGRLEAKLIIDPVPAKRVSDAPAPITPVKARSVNTPAYDTTDSRSVKQMTTSKWIEHERARLRKIYEAKGLK